MFNLLCQRRDCRSDQSRMCRCHSAWINSTDGNTAERDVELIYFVFVPQFKTHCSDRCRTSKTTSSFNFWLTDQLGGSQHVSHTDHGGTPTPPCSVGQQIGLLCFGKSESHPCKQCLTTSLQVSDMTCSLVLKVQVNVCMNNTGREILCAK